MKILAFHAHSGDPLSFLIKAITRSQYCHGAILVDDTQWRAIIAKECKLDLNTPVNGVSKHLIIEAYWPKVRTRFLREDELSEIDVFDVPALTTAQEISSIKWLISQLGVSYDGADLFRFVPQFRAVMGEATDEGYKRHTFCSMLVFNAYRFGGLRLLNCHDYEFSPDKMSWSPFAVPAPKLTSAL